MGLIASVDTNVGVPATYWKVTHIAIDMIANRITAKLNGYVSQDTSDSGGRSLAHKVFNCEYFIKDLQAKTVSVNPLFNQILTDPSGIINQIETAAVSSISDLASAVPVMDSTPATPIISSIISKNQSNQEIKLKGS